VRVLWRTANDAEYCQRSELKLLVSHDLPIWSHLAQQLERHAPKRKDADTAVWGSKFRAGTSFRGDFDG
jgi:hypothetical protein